MTACLAGCATPAKPPEEPSSQPAMQARGPAIDLAFEIARAAGADQLREVAEIDFRFAVQDEPGKLAFAADHRWDLAHNRSRITWTSRDGKSYDALLDIGSRTAEGTVDGVVAEGAAKEELSKKAYARWINDTFWLILPLKLFDPGTKLEMVEQREWNGEKHQVLMLSFDDVGLTPGDVYWLYVNTEANRIVRWEMLLQGEKEAEGVTFEEYHPVGPLLLAHVHRFEKSGKLVLIEESRASKTVDATAFKLP
jgi:hypothetical protein